MSLLSPERLAIGLAPERVAILRLHGWRRQLVARAVYNVPAVHAVGMQAWEPALNVLRQALLTEARWHKADAQVTLANTFVRYQLLPASDAISSAEEEAAYVQASFAQIHGDAAADWVYAVAEGKRGGPWFASAIDRALVARLEQTLQEAQCRLSALVPHLAATFNDLRPAIKSRDLWFVQAEPRKLMLGLIVDGRWQALQSRLTAEETWLAELPLLLDRERRVQALAAPPRRVLIVASDTAPRVLNGAGKWEFEWLRAKWRAGYSAPADAPYALALGL